MQRAPQIQELIRRVRPVHAYAVAAVFILTGEHAVGGRFARTAVGTLADGFVALAP